MNCLCRNVLLTLCHLFVLITVGVQANPDAKRLYDDLLSGYNRLIRPVGNSSDRLTVKMGLKLSQIIGVDMKRQIMITNVWVEQEWVDYKLKWNPEDYGEVKHLHVPAQNIWLPDIVLYNNADGNYEVTIMTKAILHYSGKVTWNPPAIYKSSCEIDVEFFPFDEQKCFMKFGSWTYDGYMVDLRHINQRRGTNRIEMGMDLQEYYISTEWDVMTAPAVRNEKYYPCCEEPYPDIIFYLTLRRKSLFYTVNVIIPCVGITFLSVLVFYLPSDSGEKVSLSISILLSLTVFFLLLAEIIPSTSMSVPLLGKYLLFTMILVTFSVVVTIGVLNINFRTPATHKMAPWVRKTFVDVLPRYLFIQRPEKGDEPDINFLHDEIPTSQSIPTQEEEHFSEHCSNPLVILGDGDLANKALTPVEYTNYTMVGHAHMDGNNVGDHLHIHAPNNPYQQHHHHHHDHDHDHGYHHHETSHTSLHHHLQHHDNLDPIHDVNDPHDVSATSDLATSCYGYSDYETQLLKADDVRELNPAVERAMNALKFVAQHVKNEDKFESFANDWKYVAMVLDRILLWMFLAACIVGTAGIIMAAPSHYDSRKPIDVQFSKVDNKNALRMLPDE